MKKLILGLLLASSFAFAQYPVTASRIIRGSGAPAAGLCSVAADRAKVYIRYDAAAALSSFYLCVNTTGTTTAWELQAGGGGGSGDALTSGTLAQFASTTSAQLATVISNETGTGILVFGTSPTLTTPVLGAATATSINGLTLTSSTGTFSLTNGKTFAVSNGLTLAGTDSTTMTFPATSATIARTDAANTFTGTQTVGALVATTVNGNTFTTGTGVVTIAASKTLTASNTLTLAGTDSTVMTFPSTSATIARTDAANTFTGVQTMTSPVLTTPALGTPSALVLTNATALPAAQVSSGALVNGMTASTQSAADNSTKIATTAYADAVLASRYKTKTCIIAIGDPGAASPVLANDNDSPVACSNDTGGDWTITGVGCWADAGSPTVTPILTAGTSTSILSGALTCGTAAWAAGTLNGAPVLHSFSAGATCGSTPCTADINITTAGGTAKYIVVRIFGTY